MLRLSSQNRKDLGELFPMAFPDLVFPTDTLIGLAIRLFDGDWKLLVSACARWQHFAPAKSANWQPRAPKSRQRE
jgi:hypothetical protein